MGGLWTMREQTNYYLPQPGLDIRFFVVKPLPLIIHYVCSLSYDRLI